MKITHITWGLKLGGLETMLVNIVNEQCVQHQVSLIIVNNLYDEELVKKISPRVRIYKLYRKARSRDIRPIIKLNYLLIKTNPTIIHSHAPQIGEILLPIFKNKLVYTIHDVGIPSKYFSYYKHFCAISKCVQDDVKKRTKITSTLVYNGIKVSDFKQKQYSNTKRAQNQTFKIVQISRLLHKKKGQDILIKAVSKLIYDKGLNIEIDLIGEGESKDYLLNLINQLNLNKQVHLLGAKPYSYIKNHLYNYDLLVQPSIFEGFGLTVAEGIAAKIPVLVSENEGPLEIIGNGRYGFYFKKGNVDDCADKIEEIMHTDIDELIETAYKHIQNNFNIEKTASNYIKVYKNIIEK